MRCPHCKHPDTRVLESRVPLDGDVMRRRRECGSCGKRFTTFERAEVPPLFVVKRDGSRQLFDVTKVILSMQTACRKRPVDAAALEGAAARIERESTEAAEGEITSSEVGERVMRELFELDRVAYVRFASVYGEFETLEDFQRLLDRVDRQPPPLHKQPALL